VPGPGGAGPALPRATYRVQLHAGFGFDDAAEVAGYLADLGVSHLYLSPILAAVPGSTHGYDVVDPSRVNPELGGAAGYDRLGAALGAAGLGQLLDVVPNHMAVGRADNRWWWDVLRSGPASRWAGYFDVDWDLEGAGARHAVLLPVLGDHYGRELEAGRLRVCRRDGELVVTYFEHAAPLDPATLGPLLAAAATRLAAGPERAALAGLGALCAGLPDATAGSPARFAVRQEAVDAVLARLADLWTRAPETAAAVDAEAEALSSDIERLDALLEAQNFRLAWWRSAGENLDYRRFFDINDLAALRVEESAVFADSHRLVLDLLARGVIDGVRIDHVDGLLDPGRYLRRLAGAAPEAWIVVEKILAAGERLPDSWPVAGTTGYDWLARVTSVLTAASGWEAVVAAYVGFTGTTERYEDIVYRAKLAVLDGPLAADLRRLVARTAEVCARHRRHRDHTRRDLHDALVEVLAAFGVYRSYVAPGPDGRLVAGEADEAVVEQAVRTAAVRRPDVDEDLLLLLRDVLLGRVPGEAETEVALRFQQLSGPVMAKAVEDTTFYRWVPLGSLNEVGTDPGRVDDELAVFHEGCARAQAERPFALLATSTHDTKRSEDLRARLSVLAEVPAEWERAVGEWWALAQHVALPPDRPTAWLILQTMVGAWPISEERLVAYVAKATREAKEHTSWTDPDPVYDQTVAAFVSAVLADEASRSVVERLVEVVGPAGRAVALSQKLLTLSAPGVPDLYQGSELWDLSLVDPDNRRPVDLDLRRRLLPTVAASDLGSLWAAGDEVGVVKLAVVAAALRLRRERPHCFGAGPAGCYQALRGNGARGEHLVAFARGGEVVTAVTRWPLALERCGGWADTTVELPPGVWEDVLSHRDWEATVPVGELLATLPVALLARRGGGER